MTFVKPSNSNSNTFDASTLNVTNNTFTSTSGSNEGFGLEVERLSAAAAYLQKITARCYAIGKKSRNPQIPLGSLAVCIWRVVRTISCNGPCIHNKYSCMVLLVSLLSLLDSLFLFSLVPQLCLSLEKYKRVQSAPIKTQPKENILFVPPLSPSSHAETNPFIPLS